MKPLPLIQTNVDFVLGLQKLIPNLFFTKHSHESNQTFFTLKNQANSLTINRGFKTNACRVISLNRSISKAICFADCITFKNCNNSV